MGLGSSRELRRARPSSSRRRRTRRDSRPGSAPTAAPTPRVRRTRFFRTRRPRRFFFRRFRGFQEALAPGPVPRVPPPVLVEPLPLVLLRLLARVLVLLAAHHVHGGVGGPGPRDDERHQRRGAVAVVLSVVAALRVLRRAPDVPAPRRDVAAGEERELEPAVARVHVESQRVEVVGVVQAQGARHPDGGLRLAQLPAVVQVVEHHLRRARFRVRDGRISSSALERRVSGFVDTSRGFEDAARLRAEPSVVGVAFVRVLRRRQPLQRYERLGPPRASFRRARDTKLARLARHRRVERTPTRARARAAETGNAHPAHANRRAVGDVAEERRVFFVAPRGTLAPSREHGRERRLRLPRRASRHRAFVVSVFVFVRAVRRKTRGRKTPRASAPPRSRHAPAESVRPLPSHEDQSQRFGSLRVREVAVVEDRQIARYRLGTVRRRRRHLRGLQNLENHARGLGGVAGGGDRLRLDLAAEHRKADALSRAARLAGNSPHPELCV